MILTRKVLSNICKKVGDMCEDSSRSHLRFEILKLLGEEVAVNSILTAEKAMQAYEELKRMEAKFDILGVAHFKTNTAFVAFNQNTKDMVIYSDKFEIESGDCLFEHFAFSSIDLTNVKLTDKCTSCNSMFCGCSELREVNFGRLDFSNVESTKKMFMGCWKLKEIHLSTFKNKAKLNDADRMFSACASLEVITMSGFEFDNYCSMKDIFEDCENLHKIDMNMNLTIYNKSMLNLLLKGTLQVVKVNSIDFELYTIATSEYSAEALTKIKKIKESNEHNTLLDKEDYWNKIRELIIKKDSLIDSMQVLSILNISFVNRKNIKG